MVRIAACAAALASIFACNKVETPQMGENQVPMTKAIGDKSPIMAVYVETNDVNPLNAGDYYFEDGNNETFIDILELFASNIRKETVGGVTRPTLFLNDKLANILENGGVDKYVRPLQDMGIKVLLTNLGDHQGIGLANMSDTQADQFATILAAVVKHYGLDGIGFDDEYADYPWIGGTNKTSYSRIITKLHELMPSDKLITVFDWGNTNTINAAAAACIDYAYHGYFGSYMTSTNITGLPKSKWSPLSLNLGNNNPTSTVQNYASQAKNGGYGAMMCFNLRTRNDRDPLPVFQAISNGAYDGRPVACEDGNRSRDVVINPNGFTITYDMATTWLAK
ncbi:MAG: glycosyl hydrolase family 18 protein [Bacteroidales bacterium]|nr:glycosyl hydrolase family 18 protein [Bacteroidales bacterium]